MKKLFRFLTGYLLMIIDTDSPERFFNLCRTRGIYTWGMQTVEEKYGFYMTVKDFKKSKEIIKKTHSKIKIHKRLGFPFFIFKYRKHYSFVAGIFLSSAMLYGMSLFVWDIQVDGNIMYTNNIILSYLDERDIKPGILVKDIICDNIETDMRKDFPDITWVSAEIRGTRLVVHIKENDGDVIREKPEGSADIVSDRKGVITKIITRSGTPQVKVGDTVEEGTVIVSGEVVIYNDAKEPVRSNYVYSDADVYIDTEYEYNDILPVKHEYKIYTGRQIKKKTYNVMGKQMEFGFSFKKFKEYDIITEDSVMHLTENFYLPVRSGRKVYIEYYTAEGEYTEAEAQFILRENYEVYLKKMREKGIQVLGNDITIELQGDAYVMSGLVFVNQPVTQHIARTPE